jgi:hypothetical protein
MPIVCVTEKASLNELQINKCIHTYSGRKITASFRNVTVRGEKYGKGKGEA